METRGYWTFEEETLDGTPWITRFGRGYTPVVGQTTELEPNLQMCSRTTGWRSATYTVSTVPLKDD